MSARADMESASALRQSLRAAGVRLPEGLSASGAVGVTRGAMVGDQSLRKAGWGILCFKTAWYCSSAQGQRGHLEAQALGHLPGQPAVGFFFVVGRKH